MPVAGLRDRPSGPVRRLSRSVVVPVAGLPIILCYARARLAPGVGRRGGLLWLR